MCIHMNVVKRKSLENTGKSSIFKGFCLMEKEKLEISYLHAYSPLYSDFNIE